MNRNPRQLAKDIYNLITSDLNKSFVGKVINEETIKLISDSVTAIARKLVGDEECSKYISIEVKETSPGVFAYIPRNLFTGLIIVGVPLEIAKNYVNSTSCEIDGIKFEEYEDKGILITYPKEDTNGTVLP